MFSPGGVSPPPTGNPDAQERLDTPTPTLAPRGESGLGTQSAPTPPSLRGHTHHTHPRPRGGSPRGENPAFRAVRLRRGAAERLGGPRPGEPTGCRSAAPASAQSERRAVRTKEGIPELRPRGVLLKSDSHPRQDPRRNGNNEKPPSPAIPAPRAAGGGGAISSHTPADTHTRPPSAPAPARPSAARSPAELTRGRARRARAPSPPRASLASPAPAPTRGSARRGRSETRAQAAGAAAQYGEPRLPQWSSGNTTGAAQYSWETEGKPAWPARRGGREGAGGRARGRRRGTGTCTAREGPRREGRGRRRVLPGAPEPPPRPGPPGPAPRRPPRGDAAPGQRPDDGGATSFSAFSLLELSCPCLRPSLRLPGPLLGFALGLLLSPVTASCSYPHPTR